MTRNGKLLLFMVVLALTAIGMYVATFLKVGLGS
jgi:hypothetical protein